MAYTEKRGPLRYFGIENFRIFKDKTQFFLAPISILIGANSTGKSSFSKALMLFKDIPVDGKYSWSDCDSAPHVITIADGNLNFENNENKLQLGGFENTITKGSKKKEITFSYALPIRNFPYLGEYSWLEIQIEFGKEGLKSRKFIHQGVLLIEVQGEKLYFNIEYFFDKLYFPDNYEIKDLEEFYNGGSFYDREVQGVGSYGIVDSTKESFEVKIMESNGDFTFILDINKHNLDPNHSNKYKKLPYKPIYLSDKIEYLTSLKKFYKIKFAGLGIVEQVLYNEIPVNGGGPDEYYIPEFFQNPLEELLVKVGLNKIEAEFIDKEIFGCLFRREKPKRKDYRVQMNPFEGQLDDWRSLKDRIVYHQAAVERTKRVYQLGESSLLLQNEEDIDKEGKAFIQKWCSDGGFNLGGELKIEYNAELAFWTIKVGKDHLNSQGQGITQIITLLVNICSQKEKIFIVEEPETSLHPSYQSKLADFFIEAEKEFRHQFIIETHSEYLIRRLQYLIAKKEYKAENAVIYNFRKATKDHDEVVKRIDIHDDGSLSEAFYPGFYDEAIGLELELLKLKRSALN